jgi:sugar-phosphatase
MQTLTCSAILFDLDGVLVDSTACVERHWRMWAARHGLDSEHILSISHGKRTIDTLRAVASHLDLDLEAEARRLEEKEARDLEGIVAVPGAIALVSALLPNHWAIVTSATRAMATARLRATGIPIPRAFITAEQVGQGKPHPEGYLKAAALLGVAPPDCLVIEDAPPGIQAARAGGIRVLGLTTTFLEEKLFEADLLASDLRDVHLAALSNGNYLTLRISTNDAKRLP